MNLAELKSDLGRPQRPAGYGGAELRGTGSRGEPASVLAARGSVLEATHAMNTPTPADPNAVPNRALSDVVARIGAEVAIPLTAALQRVQTMADSGRIDRQGLAALRGEIDDARRAGMRGQQIARIAGGLVQQERETLNLGTLLREVLDEQAANSPRQDEVGLRQSLASVEVLADPSLLATVLRAAADWALERARAPIEWRVDVPAAHVQARLQCRICHTAEELSLPANVVASELPPHLDFLDTLDWLLLRLAGHLANIEVTREDGPRFSVLTLRFADTVQGSLEAADSVRGVQGAAGRQPQRLPPGSQLLVLAGRRDARQQVRNAIPGHDIFIDYVPSVIAARDYCGESAPHALLYESPFAGEALRSLCEALHGQTPSTALIEITPAGTGIEKGSIGNAPVLRVAADEMRQRLSTLLADAVAQRR